MNIDSFWNGGAKAFLGRCLATCLLGIAVNSAFAQADTIPMVSFYSPGRGDYFTTSDPRWTCRLDGCADTEGLWGDYAVQAMEGHVYNPDRWPVTGASPPFAPRKLYQWYGALRGDHKLTSTSDWDPNIHGPVKVEDGVTYNFVRFEGWAAWFDSYAPYSPLQLRTYWNRSRNDYAALASVKWVSDERGRFPVGLPAGYVHVRNDVTLFPPPSAALDRCNADRDWQYQDVPAWSMRSNYIQRWAQPMDLVNGDVIRLIGGSQEKYWSSYWGDVNYFAGNGHRADPPFPAPGQFEFALVARVTTGRMYTSHLGWFEANQWFHPGAEVGGGPRECWLYDARLVRPGELEFRVNDPVLSDNNGGGPLSIRQWWD